MMPTRNVNLTAQMDGLVAERIKSGQYANASEVIRAGLRALEAAEQEAAKLEALRAAILAGEQSGVYEGDIVQDLHQYIDQLAAGTDVA